MTQLFGTGTIKSHIDILSGFEESKISLIQDLYQDWKNGLLNDEVKYKEKFNKVFFGDLLGYEDRIHRIPEGTISGIGNADLIFGNFEEGKENAENIQVVCELKGAKTNLTKKQFGHGGLSPVGQGFAYKTALKNCKWLIVSNFYEIRLYRDNQTDFEEWNLQMLMDSKDNYFNLRKLYLLLHKNNLLSSTGNSKTENLLSHFREEQKEITAKFYKEYKILRVELINDMKHNNLGISSEILIEKAQKIIDRLIFIFFCEDKGLLPDKRLKESILKAGEFDFTPWEITKRFFSSVDKGSEKLGIPYGYNGGLFKEDEILNGLKIGDGICRKFVNLTNYDFDDKLSVNVLGHIFEQSISDLESLKIDLLGTEIETEQLTDTGKGRRKKDGIFYTPEYIVDYIVQNSVMKYLNEKEDDCLSEVSTIDEKTGERRRKKNIENPEQQAYLKYQQILQNIKVLDPACGSGAFLVRVFDVLFEENKRVGSILNSLFDETETYKNILTNNIYGVDLNEESVEITKLSLWLKSAQKGKKLNNLDSNIKCGNSLIDDPEIAGDKAFKREERFPTIFHKEEVKTWMITRATHNTRISERMVDFGVQLGEPVIMDENDEIEITTYISEIVIEDNLKVLAYNICKDHVHMILQCTENERDNIVRKFKGKTTQLYKNNHNIKHELHLRGQKYNRNEIQDEKYFYNAMEYIQTNREHHDLCPVTTSKGLQPLVHKIVCSEYVFDRIEYTYSGGFDVIVGNPPYVSNKGMYKSNMEKEITFFGHKYDSAKAGNCDLYVFFIEKGLNLIKKKGYLSYIIPNKFIVAKYSRALLEKIQKHYNFVNIGDFSTHNIFPDASVYPIVILLENITTNKNHTERLIIGKGDDISIDKIQKWNYIDFKQDFGNEDQGGLFNKIEKCETINESLSFEPGINGFQFTNYGNCIVEGNFNDGKRIIVTGTIDRYVILKSPTKYKGKLYKNPYIIYNKEIISEGKWNLFCNKKITVAGMTKRIESTLDENGDYAPGVAVYSIVNSDLNILKYVLCILNSQLINRYFSERFKDKHLAGGYISINNLLLKQIPFKKSSHIEPFIEKSDQMLALNKDLHELIDKFLHRIQDNLKIEKLTKKLESFYEDDFKDFLAELKKQKVSLSLAQQDEREPYFKEYKEKILTMKGEIEKTDKEIDEMVYKLYGLTEEEVKVVEGG